MSFFKVCLYLLSISFVLTNLILGELENKVREMPKVVAAILDSDKWSGINKIDRFIEQLEKVQSIPGINVEEVITTLEEQVLKVARRKESNITTLISQFKIEDATKELNSIKLLIDLKCMAPLKAQGIQFIQ